MMKVCFLGLGVIGTTYAYVLQKAGCDVRHLVRDHKRPTLPAKLSVHLLDGRDGNKCVEYDDVYHVSPSDSDTAYDFIIVSVSKGRLEQAVKAIKEQRLSGTLVFFCNIWDDRREIERMADGFPYIIAFPTAGGCMVSNKLNCVLFDHVMLESNEKSKIPNYGELLSLLDSARIKTETAYDMLEWIWIHMAINAGVTSTAARKGNIDDPKQLALKLMTDTKALTQAVKCIRETLKVVEARGVDMKHYKNETLPYRMPAFLAGIAMKRLFARDKLASKIMTLHNDIQDILYGCRCVYDEAKRRDLPLPLFFKNMDNIFNKIENE